MLPLDKCTVIDLADEQGSFCSRLLALLGATVIRPEFSGEHSSSYFYNNSNKLLLPINLQSSQGKEKLHNLIAGSDVLIETFCLSDLEPLGLTRRRLCRINRRLVHLSITPFGRSGPRRDFHSSDSVAAAFGGQMFVTGRREAAPVKLFGEQAYYAASLFGAVAVLLRLAKRNATGKGSYIDLSIQEAVASTLDHVLVDYFHNGTITGRGESRRSDDFAILPSSDGHVLITVLRNWDTLLELMAAEGLEGKLLGPEFREPGYREQHIYEILETVRKWTSSHAKKELFELGQAMRFPWASIETLDDVLESPQLNYREFFARIPLFEEGPPAAMPGLPFKFSSVALPKPRPAAQLPGEFVFDGPESRPFDAKDQADEKILEGLRVLDLTRMLSGPYATRILADFGAEVIKIQSRKTAHGAERYDTAYFAAWNRNKRSITLDLDNPEAKRHFLRLAAESDVIVENYTPRVMANWGLDYQRLRELNPKIVMVSVSAMGHTGPWKDFAGFAPTFHALSGLISATSGNQAPPVEIGHAYADVVAGLYAALAILSAIRCRDETGMGQHIDLSAYEAMCTFLDSRFEIQDFRLGSRVYRCKGEDRWCVVTIRDEKQAELVGSLAGGFVTRPPEEIVQQLQSAGIAAGVVQSAADLARDEQLKARRFFFRLEHPILGTMLSDRSALWDWRQRPKHWKAAPLPGEHNKQFGIRD